MSADALVDWLLDRAAEGMADAGRSIVNDVRAKLDNAATDQPGPLGGRRVAGALRGHYPNRRTGRLRAGVTSAVERVGDAVTLTVDDPVPYGAILQDRGYVVTSDVAGRADDVSAAAVAAINAG